MKYELATILSIIALAVAGKLPEAGNLPESGAHPDAPKAGDLDNVSVKVLTPEQLKLFRAANPEAVFTPLEGIASSYSIRYTLGSRKSYDSLVSVSSNYYSWSTSQNVQLSLSYPSSGVGKIITYVEVLVQQSYNSGRAYVVSGGIGYRSISLVVESNDTTYLQYNSSIYGY